jgi:hypothetical protein
VGGPGRGAASQPEVGGAGRVKGGGRDGSRGVGRCGPVRRCYAALLIWLSSINTILALCVRSDGECDLMLVEILINASSDFHVDSGESGKNS